MKSEKIYMQMMNCNKCNKLQINTDDKLQLFKISFLVWFLNYNFLDVSHQASEIFCHYFWVSSSLLMFFYYFNVLMLSCQRNCMSWYSSFLILKLLILILHTILASSWAALLQSLHSCLLSCFIKSSELHWKIHSKLLPVLQFLLW